MLAAVDSLSDALIHSALRAWKLLIHVCMFDEASRLVKAVSEKFKVNRNLELELNICRMELWTAELSGNVEYIKELVKKAVVICQKDMKEEKISIVPKVEVLSYREHCSGLMPSMESHQK